MLENEKVEHETQIRLKERQKFQDEINNMDKEFMSVYNKFKEQKQKNIDNKESEAFIAETTQELIEKYYKDDEKDTYPIECIKYDSYNIDDTGDMFYHNPKKKSNLPIEDSSKSNSDSEVSVLKVVPRNEYIDVSATNTTET